MHSTHSHKKNTDYKLPRVVSISIDTIERPNLIMRSQFDSGKLTELADSIANVGLLQPLVVVRRGDKYKLIAGDRRLAALQLLNKHTADCVVLNVTDSAAAFITFHENSYRTDPDIVDEAFFLSELKKLSTFDNRTLAKHINKSEQYVSQRLSILDWPPLLVSGLKNKQISFSAARELSYIDDADTLTRYLNYAFENGITPSVARSWRMQYQSQFLTPDPPAKTDAPITDPSVFKAQTMTCQACLQPSELREMQNIWVHIRCWQDILNALLTSGTMPVDGPG